ncbi:hypothetical protein BD289DRAFT_456756 [Coniella lustricola]|uniref:Uncharacterized protein n=1 Tax=Coniella lustricola TaxID=2025994 RepID=A0A2T2ZUL5_9PEZI|nr:hypothetical protein BD289DRAFT_456756 [Coniella lustricola]
MRFIKLIAAANLLSGVLALPQRLEQRCLTDIDKRATSPKAPTVEEVREWIKTESGVSVGENTVFYASPVKDTEATSFAATIGGTLFSEVFKNKRAYEWMPIPGPGESAMSKDQQDLIIPHMSQALAEESKVKAWVMLQEGATISPDGIWIKYEFPALQKNGVEVWQVAPGGKKKQKYTGKSPVTYEDTATS